MLIKEQYPSLNGLRAVSILIVIFSHLVFHYSLLSTLPRYFPMLTDGQFGVNVFFVISGFIITTLLIREEKTDGKISLKKFYIRRTLRIFPAYYFILFVCFILSRYRIMLISPASWLTSITYTKYFNWNLDWYTAHFWSLSVEEHFYLFWPFVFRAGKKIRSTIVLIIIFLIPFIRWYFQKHTDLCPLMNTLTIFYRLDAIATGCLCALYCDSIIKWLTPNWNKVFFISMILLFCPYISDFIMHLGFLTDAVGTSHRTIANILIAVVMMYSVFGPRGIWFNFLNLKIMHHLGLWSYSLYLWQQFFIYKTDYWFNTFPLNLILLLCTALFSHYIIEKPFLKLKARFSG